LARGRRTRSTTTMSASATTPCDVPVPSGSAHRTRSDLHLRRRQRAYRTMLGKAVLFALRIRLLRPAGGERRHQSGTHHGSSPRRASSSSNVADSTRRRLRLASRDSQPRPEIIRWSQTIFLDSEGGLAYRAEAPVTGPGAHGARNEQVLPMNLRTIG